MDAPLSALVFPRISNEESNCAHASEPGRRLPRNAGGILEVRRAGARGEAGALRIGPMSFPHVAVGRVFLDDIDNGMNLFDFTKLGDRGASDANHF